MCIPKSILLTVCTAASFLTLAQANETVSRPDKWKYNLFNSVPSEYLRDMSTDRPDQTESPYTVDAGRYQIELSFFDYTYDKAGSVRFEQWNAVPRNFKGGLLNNVDLQVVLDNFISQRTKDSSDDSIVYNEGFGDVTTRLKINLWGNDEGKTALALMPFIKAPTNSGGVGNNSPEGGIIIPFATELPGGWSLGIMTEFDVMRNGNDNGNHAEFVNSITVSRDIIGKLGGYAEFFTRVVDEDNSDWQGQIDFGLTYSITENLNLDAGCNFGVTESADDFNPFAGLSVRF